MAEIRFPTHEMIIRQVASDSYWQVKILTYDESNNLLYLACNRKHLAATDDETWYVWKYTWTDGNCTLMEGPLLGSVDGQDSLAWRA